MYFALYLFHKVQTLFHLVGQPVVSWKHHVRFCMHMASVLSFRIFLFISFYLSLCLAEVLYPQCDPHQVIHPPPVTGCCFLQCFFFGIQYKLPYIIFKLPVKTSSLSLDCKLFEGMGQKGHSRGMRNKTLVCRIYWKLSICDNPGSKTYCNLN